MILSAPFYCESLGTSAVHGSSAGIPEARRSGTEVRRGGTEVRRSGTEVRRGALISCEEDLGSSAGGGLKSEMTCFNSKGFETCFQFERLRKGFRKASKGFERLRRVVTYFQFERRRQGGMRIEVNESGLAITAAHTWKRASKVLQTSWTCHSSSNISKTLKTKHTRFRARMSCCVGFASCHVVLLAC